MASFKWQAFFLKIDSRKIWRLDIIIIPFKCEDFSNLLIKELQWVLDWVKEILELPEACLTHVLIFEV